MLDGEELLIEFVGSAPAPAEKTSSVTIDPLQSIQSAPVYVNNSYNGDYENEEDEDQSSFWGLAAGGSNRRGNRYVLAPCRVDQLNQSPHVCVNGELFLLQRPRPPGAPPRQAAPRRAKQQSPQQ